jgi:hypothetical protein
VPIISAFHATSVHATDGTAGESKIFFPGRPGILHNPDSTAFDEHSEHWNLLGELSLPHLQRLSFMFNFQRETTLLGTKRVCLQLNDSEWSGSFSLDTMEIIQSLSIDHLSGALEIGFTVVSAPGRLGKYTKIVRFKPKFAVLNKLDMELQLIQPELFTNVINFVGSVPSNKVLPFHLTNPYSERKLAIRVVGSGEDSWKDSVAFSVDQLGSYTMQINKRVQLKSTDYISTRENNEFIVVVPRLKEFGLYFETDWDATSIVVKGYKANSVAYLETDIQIGDVLIALDNQPVYGRKFEDVMQELKEKVHGAGCSLTFRTVEEKLRMVVGSGENATVNLSPRRNSVLVVQNHHNGNSEGHLSAAQIRQAKTFSTVGHAGANRHAELSNNEMNGGGGGLSYRFNYDSIPLRVELRQFESTSLILVHKADSKACSEYQIFNYSVSHIIYYKQKNILGNRWAALGPGESVKYIWEDPFSSHKLLIRAGENVLCPSVESEHKKNLRMTLSELGDTFIVNPVRQISGRDSDSKITVVGLDEIGYKGKLPLAYSKGELNVRIESEGPSKQLYIFPEERLDPDFGAAFSQKQLEKLIEMKAILSTLVSLDDSVIFEVPETETPHDNSLVGSSRLRDILANSNSRSLTGVSKKIHLTKGIFVKSIADEKEKICRSLLMSNTVDSKFNEPRSDKSRHENNSTRQKGFEIETGDGTRTSNGRRVRIKLISESPDPVEGEEHLTTSARACFDTILGDDDMPDT